MSQKHIELYRTRDFGAKINVTIEYIRYNLVPLIKVVLLVVVPMGLLFSLLFSNLFSSFSTIAGNPNMSEVETIGFLGAVGANYMLMIILGVITYSFMLAGVYSYIKMNDKQEGTPQVMDVYRNALPKIPGLVLLSILIGVICMVGFFIFILPGIYLMITLSIAVPAYLFEDIGIGGALGKSFKLIRDKWWSTFGLIIITGIIAMIVSYIFSIPMYAGMFGQMFSNVTEASEDPEAVFAIFSSWYTTLGMAVIVIGSQLTYLIPEIALAFQYFNLSERMEGTGIRSQIKDFEALT